MTPRSPGTKPEKMTNSEDPVRKSVESCGTRSFIQFREKLAIRAHMQKGEGSRRLGNQCRTKEVAD
jgi:hypothetical protein